MNAVAETGSKRGWWQAIERPFKQLDLERVRQRRWWIVPLLVIGGIVLLNFVRSWADCQFFYQAELDYYLAHPDSSVRPPQPPSTPLVTVLVRIGGQALSTALTWAGWVGGLYLLGLLFGQSQIRLGAVLRVVAWSWLPFVVRALAQCVYIRLTRDPMFNAGLSGLAWDNTPPPPGGGYHYVMPTHGQLIWSAILVHMDLYLFWHLGLIVSGLLRSCGLTPRKALLITSIVTVTLALIGLAPVLIGGPLQRFRLF